MKTRRQQHPEGGPTAVPSDSFLAFEELAREVSILYHRLRTSAAQVHGQGQLSGGRRELLRDLDREGERTVPQIARVRSFSRQHAQVVVNSLLEEGYVELRPNPAHARSHLVALTPSGKRFVDSMVRREGQLWAVLGAHVSERGLRDASATLRQFRQVLEGRQWRALMAEPRPAKRAAARSAPR